MTTDSIVFFPDLNQEEFDYNVLLGNSDYATISGIPVKIDRIIRDITQTTVIAVSGTMVVRGVKVRGIWNMYGDIVEFRRIFRLFSPKGYDLNALFYDTTSEIFKLVHIQAIKNKKEKGDQA